jgi:sulfoxide reductase catalytic subunit YedY
MLIKSIPNLTERDVTDERLFQARRDFLRSSLLVAGGLLSSQAIGSALATPKEGLLLADQPIVPTQQVPLWLQAQLKAARAVDKSSVFFTQDKVAPYKAITQYNNFYEFGTDKTDPSEHASALHTDPWSVEIAGEVENPANYHLEDLLKPYMLEERIYRLRCVEAWSMVIPWIGFPLADLIKKVKPTSKAKFVEFTSIYRPEEMPGQKSAFSTIKWPYVEGLRMDEAMHPLTFMAVGLYGQSLPPHNGAPFRLVVPWKYGFKSAKSIVKIRFVEEQPLTAWQSIAPNEYGFYSNVNPDVDHPRWSQKSERRLPATLLNPLSVETQPFNGYAEQVASLYAGMDLRKDF